ncbi:MAG: HDOD domain-containing protein [Thiomicrospira sp.]|uniref:HDOD domain-containing protein n=1 Tax=Thiomicrospira sp. TaxID=935 RepID=UPI0019D84D67|nr:HDOD domain-containing protein [Thiomicrospira sp.]MBE0493929.1 HDOD domain-containing protein [Thiomicrospira sp.]
MSQVTTKQLVDALAEVKRLPHMPEALLKLNKLLSDPAGVHVDRVAEVIMQDLRLTTGLLKAVNSSKYQMGKEITTLPEAIARLGVNDLRVLALAINYSEAFKPDLMLDRDVFLQHGLLAAHIGSGLAKQVSLKVNPYYGFMIGLMHEIGQYMLLQSELIDYKSVVEASHHKVSALVTLENKMLGFSHANIGARLLKTWGFPKDVYMGVLGHHSPHLLDAEFQRPAYVGFLAEVGALSVQGQNGLVRSDSEKFSATTLRVLQRFNLTQDVFLAIIEKAQEQAKS